jgi:hypothetical protein
MLLSIVVRLAALFFAATTSAALYRVLHARQSGLSTGQAAIIAGIAGFGFQLGLLLAPSTIARGPRARTTAGLLMLPGMVLLVAMLVGALQRYPHAVSVAAITATGVLIYAVQYAVLWRVGRSSKGSPEPAV